MALKCYVPWSRLSVCNGTQDTSHSPNNWGQSQVPTTSPIVFLFYQPKTIDILMTGELEPVKGVVMEHFDVIIYDNYAI